MNVFVVGFRESNSSRHQACAAAFDISLMQVKSQHKASIWIWNCLIQAMKSEECLGRY